MAEWLGRGLQNLVQRFESASDLSNCRADDLKKSSVLFCALSVSEPIKEKYGAQNLLDTIFLLFVHYLVLVIDTLDVYGVEYRAQELFT